MEHIKTHAAKRLTCSLSFQDQPDGRLEAARSDGAQGDSDEVPTVEGQPDQPRGGCLRDGAQEYSRQGSSNSSQGHLLTSGIEYNTSEAGHLQISHSLLNLRLLHQSKEQPSQTPAPPREKGQAACSRISEGSNSA